jgi:hypothetical protein
MILDGGPLSFDAFGEQKFDLFIYALGFETRATKLASHCVAQKIIALKMPDLGIHSYRKNCEFASTRKHRVVDNIDNFLESELPSYFRKAGDRSLVVGFDISSVNRIILFDVLIKLATVVRSGDQIGVYYCPAAFTEPDWQFPCIEKLGPITPGFSSFNADPSKPLCLMLGMGFEAGVSMGIISQLEPRLSYCFWGTGVSNDFDRAVRRANFDFDFTGFNTKVLSYDIKDPKGAFNMLDAVIYGLMKDYRIVVVPMGPKIFALLTALVGMTYFGDVAVWRVQHGRVDVPDSAPGKFCISSRLNAELLSLYADSERRMLNDEFGSIVA